MSDLSLRHEPERRQREILDNLFEDTQQSVFDLFRSFPVYAPRFNIARFLAHYEIFKKIIELPGVIVELGVYRGASLFTWGKLCEIFCPTDVKKVVYGFDSFEGFPSVSEEDGDENKDVDLVKGGFNPGDNIVEELLQAQSAMSEDKHIKHINRIELIKGDVIKTIPEFVEEQKGGLKIALLNLDLDLYEPTRVALEHFVPLMAKGGIIIADEYADNHYGGETKAIDNYFKETKGSTPLVKKFSWHSNPAGYIEVDW